METVECDECGDVTDTSDIVYLNIERQASDEYPAVKADLQLCIDCWDSVVRHPIETGYPAIDPTARETESTPDINDIIESISEDQNGHPRKHVERATVVETAVYEHDYEPQRVEKELSKLTRKGEIFRPEDHKVCSVGK